MNCSQQFFSLNNYFYFWEYQICIFSCKFYLKFVFAALELHDLWQSMLHVPVSCSLSLLMLLQLIFVFENWEWQIKVFGRYCQEPVVPHIDCNLCYKTLWNGLLLNPTSFLSADIIYHFYDCIALKVFYDLKAISSSTWWSSTWNW